MSDFTILDPRQLPAISEQEEAELLGAEKVDESEVKAAVEAADPETLADTPEEPDAAPEVSDDPYDLPEDLLNLIEDIDPDDLEEIDDLEEEGDTE